MQREISRSSQLALTSGIRRESSEFVTVPSAERAGRAAGRRGRLWILTEPAASSGGATAAAKLVMETIEEEYYHGAAASITSALEEAVGAANRLLHEYNQGAPAHKQAYLGVSCVAIHKGDAYVAQVQPARAVVVHQGSPRTFPEGPPRPEAELTPLGLDPDVEVELYRSPFVPGDTLTLLSAGIARLVSRSEDEYSLSYQDHAGAVGYLAHLAARENALDEHALVVEEPPALRSGGSLDSLGREWVRQSTQRLGESIRRTAGRVSGAELGGKKLSGSFLVQRARAVSPRIGLPAAGAMPGKPSRTQLAATIIGGLFLLLLAVGLGTRAYRGYAQAERVDTLLASAAEQRKQARGKATEAARLHLSAAGAQLEEARKLEPEDPRIQAELTRLAADRNAVNKVVRLPSATKLAVVHAPRKGNVDRLIIMGERAITLDKSSGTVRMYDLKDDRSTVLSPKRSVKFVGLSFGDDEVVALDRSGHVWRYDLDEGSWGDRELGGKVKWADVVGFDTYGTRAYVAVKGKKAVLAYELTDPDEPKVLSSKVKGQALAPAGLSADGNVWLLHRTDDSIWKLSNDKVTRRLWVDVMPRIKGARGLVALDTNRYLYFLDRRGDRILQVAPTGQLQAQLHLPRNLRRKGRIEALYPDEDDRALYAVVGGTLYRTPLQVSPRRR